LSNSDRTSWLKEGHNHFGAFQAFQRQSIAGGAAWLAKEFPCPI
jgi:hypothetical protein